ncbi:putative g-protein coupled receptor 21 [Gigaspora margarita]|uniref:Putative g-protein coupled receptor 21 n=1 Tax=Gigaspora margarita TaxID=4874 RepID=A0A8H4EQG9_GIGMA|nr:putative g-protein coupled receptor 21 [Gigaspora margarita]
MSNMSNIYSGTNLRELPGFDIILPSGLISGIPNLICIIYVLVRTLTRWWVTKRSLPMAHRVPFYIAVTGCINLPMLNKGYSAIHGETLQGVGCKIAGGVTFFCVTVNMTLGGLLSLTTYLRICKKCFFNTGIYDYKFLSIILSISLTLTLIGVNDYGPNKFWCYSAPTDPITPLITAVMIFLIMIVTIFFYIMTLFEVNIQLNKIRKLGSDSASFSRLDLIVAKKIIGYILIFIIEWTPSMIYFIAQMLQYDNMWIYTVAVVAINFGGVGNAIIYIIYENWTNKYDSSSKTDDSLKNSEGSNNTLVLNSTSGAFKNNQDSYSQVKAYNSITIEKEITTFSSSNLDISNQD